MKEEKHYCGGKRYKSKVKVQSNCNPEHQNNYFKRIYFQEKNTYNYGKSNDLNENNNKNDKTESLVLDKIKESIKKFEEKKLPYDGFLNYSVPNFLNLKKNGCYNRLIAQFKKTKRRALVLKKGFIFSESFNRWLLNKYPNLSEQIKKINENFEVNAF